MSEKRAFVRAATVVAAITALSRVMGLARDAVVGALLGAGRVNDVFQIAFELPNLARRVLGEGSLSAFIVPLFVGERREKGEAAGWLYASNALTAVVLLGAALTALGCLFAKPLFLVFGGMGLLARGGEAEYVALGASLTRWMFPYLMLLAASALLMGLCHAVRRFAAPACGSIMINLTMIGAGWLFWSRYGAGMAEAEAAGDMAALAAAQTRFAYWLAGAVLLGILLRAFVHFPPLMREGFRYRPHLDLKQPRLRELFAKMPMALAGMAVAHVMISINMFFAMFMSPGYATQLRYANHLAQMPLGILASAMATAILPPLTRCVQERDADELCSLFGFALRLTLILFLPATVGMIALGGPIVGALFERGQWNAEATAGTAWALLFYAAGMLPAAGLRLATPLYYARLDLRTPVIAGVAAVGVNIALNYTFYRFTNLNQGGLALATTLTMAANLGLLLYWMRGEIGGAFNRRLLETAWKCLAAAGCMGAALAGAMWLWQARWGEFSGFADRASFLALAIPAGMAVYFGAAAALRAPDLSRAMQVVRRRGKTPPG